MDGARLPDPDGPVRLADPPPAGARIGPNAILQLIAVLDHCEGRVTRDLVLERAGVVPPPADAGMWPEEECAAVHRALRTALPDRAEGLLRLAGLAVGDCILAHRIPRPAQWLIRALPGMIGALILTRAIQRHAWTFAGSGRFRVLAHWPLTFEIASNPLIRGEDADHAICHGHAAVFERLYARLCFPSAVVREVACAATGAPACRFVLSPGGA